MPETLAANLIGGDEVLFLEPWVLRLGGMAGVLRARWDSLCREIGRNGKIEELHECRGDVRAVFDRHLDLFKNYFALLDLTEQMTERNGPVRHARELVARETEELTRLYDEIFPRWQTLDDLAALLIERMQPTPERLKTLAEAYPPPQSWYDDDFDPFTPDAPE